MKETLKDKFNTIKTNVKQTWDKASDADKTKVQGDLKDRNYPGAGQTVKDNFIKPGKV